MVRVFREDFAEPSALSSWQTSHVEIEDGHLQLEHGFSEGTALIRVPAPRAIQTGYVLLNSQEVYETLMEVQISRNGRHFTNATLATNGSWNVETFKETDGTADFVDSAYVADATNKTLGIRLKLRSIIIVGAAFRANFTLGGNAEFIIHLNPVVNFDFTLEGYSKLHHYEAGSLPLEAVLGGDGYAEMQSEGTLTMVATAQATAVDWRIATGELPALMTLEGTSKIHFYPQGTFLFTGTLGGHAKHMMYNQGTFPLVAVLSGDAYAEMRSQALLQDVMTMGGQPYQQLRAHSTLPMVATVTASGRINLSFLFGQWGYDLGEPGRLGEGGTRKQVIIHGQLVSIYTMQGLTYIAMPAPGSVGMDAILGGDGFAAMFESGSFLLTAEGAMTASVVAQTAFRFGEGLKTLGESGLLGRGKRRLQSITTHGDLEMVIDVDGAAYNEHIVDGALEMVATARLLGTFSFGERGGQLGEVAHARLGRAIS